MMNRIIIHWFRQDLRLTDNPSLNEASKLGEVLPLYIFDNVNVDRNSIGGAAQWWLHQQLNSLNKSLDDKLCILEGDALKLIPDLIAKTGASGIFWNRCYEPWRISRDKILKENILSENIEVRSFNGSLLWEPWEVLKKDGSPYKVFTPFYKRGCMAADPPRTPIHKPKSMKLYSAKNHSQSLLSLSLLTNKQWEANLAKHWNIGESAAQTQLHTFINRALKNYKNDRDFPAISSTSKLSVHLHWGSISPNMIWYETKKLQETKNSNIGINTFMSQLAWREFSYSLLYYFPNLPNKNLQSKFDNFPWRKDRKLLKSWQKGRTGYPIIDAGMRELWETGYMHNRVRMISGSFLVKNLLMDWRDGEAWFWDTLVDADLANNSASWQWIAGCGADAAPFFRIFNPTRQSQRFDPKGLYIRKWLPEISRLPTKYIHEPWLAPSDVLLNSNIVIGNNYPHPIVDHSVTRKYALDCFNKIKNK
ncbi:MAG: deoxyribodipyrimidine photo-lyase [Alphaproteobacteria bacterium]|nr:deoxyribodipyrimidine photo-lyase [Alphaproteobacteria bacterium]